MSTAPTGRRTLHDVFGLRTSNEPRSSDTTEYTQRPLGNAPNRCNGDQTPATSRNPAQDTRTLSQRTGRNALRWLQTSSQHAATAQDSYTQAPQRLEPSNQSSSPSAAPVPPAPQPGNQEGRWQPGDISRTLSRTMGRLLAPRFRPQEAGQANSSSPPSSPVAINDRREPSR